MENREPVPSYRPSLRVLLAIMAVVASAADGSGFDQAAIAAGGDSIEQAAAVSCTLIIPEGACGANVFQDYRSPELEYQLLSMVTFASGTYHLPMTEGVPFEMELFESYEFGPGREPGASAGPGNLTLRVTQAGDYTYYNYTYVKSYLVGLEEIRLTWDSISFRDEGAGGELIVTLDEGYLCHRLYLYGQVDMGGPWPEALRYESPRYAVLPLWIIKARSMDGDRVDLFERFQFAMAGSGPANLVWGRVQILEGEAQVRDYWHLVYAAGHHNWDPYYWVVLDPPLGDVFVVEVHLQDFELEPDHLWMLNQEFKPIRTPRLMEIGRWTLTGGAIWELY